MINRLANKWRNIPLTVKVSTAYAVSSILQKCLSFITLPLFSRLLTTEQYGQYTIYQSWSSIITIFITLNLAYGSFSTAMIKFEDRRDEYVSSIEGISLLLAATFILIYIPFRNLWNQMLELPTFIVAVMVLDIVMQNAILLWNGKKRFEFKYKSVIAVTLLTSFISPFVAYILIRGTEAKGYARILGYAGTTIIFGSVILIVNLIKGKKPYNKEFWSYAFRFNIPLLIYYLSQVVFNQSDRIMISHIQGTSAAAMYGVAYNLAMILTFILNAINNSYVPWLYGKIKEKKAEENKSVACVIAILMALMILCVIWYAPEIILIMAGSKYMEAVYVVAPVAMSLLLLFYTQLFINIQFYYEEKKLIIWASIWAAIINIILNALLIPKFGFVAAGYTTFISYIVFCYSNYVAMKKVFEQQKIEDNLYDYKILILILATFIISSLLGVILYKSLIIRIIITAVVLGILLFYRKKIEYYIRTVKGEG